jgi:iron complex outermembrane recepter protein
MQDEIGIIPGKLALTLGSKFENNSFSGLEIQPSTRLAWSRTSRQTIWGAVSRLVRTPSRIEEGFRYTALIQPAIPLYVRIIGDGQITPEQMTGYELGYRFQVRKSAVLGFAGFHNRYDDLLSVENRARDS